VNVCQACVPIESSSLDAGNYYQFVVLITQTPTAHNVRSQPSGRDPGTRFLYTVFQTNELVIGHDMDAMLTYYTITA
jgi:hypothetical protein